MEGGKVGRSERPHRQTAKAGGLWVEVKGYGEKLSACGKACQMDVAVGGVVRQAWHEQT